jgi:hypothetical protein
MAADGRLRFCSAVPHGCGDWRRDKEALIQAATE